MRVLFVAPHLPPKYIGGVEVYTHGLMRAVARRGHDVTGVAVEHVVHGDADACTVTAPDRSPADEPDAVRLTMTLGPAVPFRLLDVHAPTEAWFDALLVRARPDVVHVQSGYLLGASAIRAARRAGIAVVVSLHDYWFSCPRVTLMHPGGAICTGPERPEKCAWCLSADRRRYRIVDAALGGRLSAARDLSTLWRSCIGGPVAEVTARQAMMRDLLESAAVVLAPTRFVASKVAETGFPLDRIRVAPYGIAEMSPGRPVPRGRELRVAYVGQIVPHKGVHLAIDAVRALPGREVALTVHGPLTVYPDYVARLRASAAGDARITFAGPYDHDTQGALFASTDVVVVPSVWHEVAALVIQEAQMAGVPVVASAVGGSPELVSDGVNGLLFDVTRPGALAAALARLLDEPALLGQLQAAQRPPRSVESEVDALVEIFTAIGPGR